MIGRITNPRTISRDSPFSCIRRYGWRDRIADTARQHGNGLTERRHAFGRISGIV